MNTSCLAKLGWNFKRRSNSIWASLMKNKYLSRRIESGSLIDKPFDSYLWKAIEDMCLKIDSLYF